MDQLPEHPDAAFTRFRLRAAEIVLALIVVATLYDVFAPAVIPASSVDLGVYLSLVGLLLGLLGLGSVVKIVGAR